jgi:hypothetical protein
MAYVRRSRKAGMAPIWKTCVNMAAGRHARTRGIGPRHLLSFGRDRGTCDRLAVLLACHP